MTTEIKTTFWCRTHLEDLPIEKRSPDPRYCQDCYDFLCGEAEVLIERGSNRRPWWWPRPMRNENLGALKGGMAIGIPPANMSILKTKNSSMDIIQPATPLVMPSELSFRRVKKVTHGRRGPKQKDLPVALIKRWHGEGLGSNAITTRLKKEKGISISYKTVQRLLKGERPLL